MSNSDFHAIVSEIKKQNRGSVKRVETILKQGFDVNERDRENWNFLHTSCFYNSLKFVKLFLSYKIDVNTSDKYGWTPFDIACFKCSFEIISLLYQNGATINTNVTSNFPATPENSFQILRKNNYSQYKKMLQWLTENHPDIALELMAEDSSQKKPFMSL